MLVILYLKYIGYDWRLISIYSFNTDIVYLQSQYIYKKNSTIRLNWLGHLSEMPLRSNCLSPINKFKYLRSA